MSLTDVFVPLFTHFIPILFFVYMAADVLLRNTKRTEHLLLSLICVLYLLLFTAEYVRNQLPIAYSPAISSLWFVNAGILIPGTGFHFLIKFTRLDKKMPRYVYPYVFYLPVIIVILNLATNAKIISVQDFVQQGMWKMPVYNDGYYAGMTASIVNNLLYLIPLIIGRSMAGTREHRAIYRHLIYGVIIVAAWHVVFGYIDFGGSLPPYPYLYGGAVWCFFLRHTMKKYDFMNLFDKRYEKLFNLNPAAILLVDPHGAIKDANPSAKQLFESIHLDANAFNALLGRSLKDRIQGREVIHNFETTIVNGDKRLDLLVDGDYVWVDNEPFVLLILRDMTIQKENQEKILFLAYHDPLTRLPNRRYFYDKLDEAIREAGAQGRTLAVVLIDLDAFKSVNDKYGHQAGDEMLLHAANLIQEAARQRGMAARLGGDEFVMYIDRDATVQQVRDTIAQLRSDFAQHVRKYGATPVGMSIGASFYPQDGTDGDALMIRADQAMYEAKRQGRERDREMVPPPRT